MKPISNKTIERRAQRPLRILQFGGGNFLRAFVDWIVQELNEKTDFNGGVVIVKPTESSDYRSLREQDGLFHTILNGVENGTFFSRIKRIDCVQKIVHPYREWETYLDLARNPDLKFIVSNTTEAGIRFDEKDDSYFCTPKEFPGKVTAFLYRRFLHFQGDTERACVFLPCELVENNGDVLKQCILQYAELWELGQEFTNWVDQNTFCDTLVDRIVSGFPHKQADAVEQEIGFRDSLLVMGEFYHNWVIAGPDRLSAELPFAKAGLNCQFVEDLAIHRQIKVRLLNGAHTSLVPVGLLAGIETVGQAMADPVVKQFISEELEREIIPTIEHSQQELTQFASDVLDRFQNPSLQHKLADIALNSTSKFKARLLPTLLDYLQKEGKLPHRIAFAMAALIRFYEGNWKGQKLPVKDSAEAVGFFADTWHTHRNDLETLVRKILANDALWGRDLNALPALSSLLVSHLKRIEGEDMRTVLGLFLI